ncbi:MAG: hypothetical protein C4522_02675 [Desulfobacteraceae bacterium]|nr:MAG: hypothetical protein C4522_02675 [Desulfobacteraceae bacterium]
MNCKFILFLSFLCLCLFSNAFGAVQMRFENRWPFAPAKSIAVSDDYVFQAFGNVILVIDKTDFSNAAPVKRIYLNVSEGITNLRYHEPFLFVTTGHHGLSKINVSPQSITNPAIVTKEPIPAWIQSEIDAGATESGTARDVAINGNNAYVAFTKLYENGIYETGIQVVDITDTSSLVLKNLGLVTNDAIANGLASGLTESRRIMVSGNYAYIADTAQGIHLFNIAADTPEFLDITGFLPTFDISVPGDGFAYAACTAGGIQILDIATDPNIPSITTIYANPTGDDPDDELTYFQYNDATTFARSLQTAGNRTYIADGNSGLEILDVSNRSNPQKLSTYSTNLNNAYSVHVDTDNTLYLADFQSGLTKVNISSPESPSLISSIQHHAASANRFFVNIEGDIFYSYTLDSGTDGEGLRILKFEKVSNIYGNLVSNSEFQNVRFQSFLETPGQAQDIEVIHYKISESTTFSFAFIADGTGGLQIIDVTNKSTPSNTTLTDNTEINDSRAVELDSSGSFAFVADGSNGLRILQILAASDTYPVRTPTLLDTIAPPSGGTAKDVLFTSKGSAPNLEYYLYVAAGTAGLQIIRLDLPNTASETITGTLISSIDTDGDTKSVTVFDKYAFLADGDKGLKIINISDPSTPTQVGTYDTPGDASRVWIRQASANTVYAYIADGDKGIRAIDVSDPTIPIDFNPALTYDTAGFAGDIAVNQTGDMTIIGDGSGGLTMISISDPEAGRDVDYTDTESPDISDSGCFIQSSKP